MPRRVREILAQAVADAIAECAQREPEFIRDLNAVLEHRGYTVQLHTPNHNEKGETPAGTYFRDLDS
jgi:hypothetical protein